MGAALSAMTSSLPFPRKQKPRLFHAADRARLQRVVQRIGIRFARVFADDLQQSIERFSERFSRRPARELFGNLVDRKNTALRVRGYHTVANRIKRDRQPLLFRGKRGFGFTQRRGNAFRPRARIDLRAGEAEQQETERQPAQQRDQRADNAATPLPFECLATASKIKRPMAVQNGQGNFLCQARLSIRNFVLRTAGVRKQMRGYHFRSVEHLASHQSIQRLVQKRFQKMVGLEACKNKSLKRGAPLFHVGNRRPIPINRQINDETARVIVGFAIRVQQHLAGGHRLTGIARLFHCRAAFRIRKLLTALPAVQTRLKMVHIDNGKINRTVAFGFDAIDGFVAFNGTRKECLLVIRVDPFKITERAYPVINLVHLKAAKVSVPLAGEGNGRIGREKAREGRAIRPHNEEDVVRWLSGFHGPTGRIALAHGFRHSP